ncbi:hypothetical protein B0H66DRAFT_562921 [Apodospora peruviana]|uniref:Uncharacterized protein n=1 Tax=Apodospora peruviana TaxID=516989 RepID=A0AAE0M0J5_9PEZI|nr:hypothetical protein B0H66DRAFT_562921 [Apodospora peruviana]
MSNSSEILATPVDVNVLDSLEDETNTGLAAMNPEGLDGQEPKQPYRRDDYISEEEDGGELDEASAVVALNPTGDEGSGYHILNDPARPFQRETAVEHRGVIEIQCKAREIVHGKLSSSLQPDGDDEDEDDEAYATLLVYEIHMNPRKASQRIVSVTVEFEFRSSEAGAPDPRVRKIGPLGRVGVLSTQQDEMKKVGGELSLSGGPEMIANVGMTGTVEKSVSRTTTDEARVTGSIWHDNYDHPVIARWMLQENRSAKSGVPSFLRCAILLAREENNLFEARITIKADADWKSSLKTSAVRLFGGTPRDDPVLFDPSLKPTNKLRKAGYDTGNLGDLDLRAEFVDIRFSTAFVPKMELLD